MRLQTLIDNVWLLFRKDREPYLRLRRLLGFLPHDIRLYRLALHHKSAAQNDDARPDSHPARPDHLNNERLEFLGDAVLGSAVAHILYNRFPDKQEGFLTTLRSKLVRRDMLNDLAVQMGLDRLVLHAENASSAHNSYMNGNAFEALIGAIYLDRGYSYCLRFLHKQVFAHYVDIGKVAKREENYKSRLIEWCQKQHLTFRFDIVSQKTLSDRTTAKFVSRVLIQDIYCGSGDGYTKKESHQAAARQAWKRLHKDNRLLQQILHNQPADTAQERQP